MKNVIWKDNELKNNLCKFVQNNLQFPLTIKTRELERLIICKINPMEIIYEIETHVAVWKKWIYDIEELNKYIEIKYLKIEVNDPRVKYLFLKFLLVV